MNVVDRDTTLCISLAARPGNHGTRFHNHLYDQLGLNFLYLALSSSDIGATIAGVRSLGIRGVSVSMPYKESCIEHLDGLDPSAAAIDAVNTVVNEDGVLTGYNTDYLAVRELVADLPRVPFALRGSGGMAKAVLAALVDSGFRDGTVVARNEAAGAALAGRYGVRWSREAPADAAFLLNATPVGMAGGPAAEAAALPFPAGLVRASVAVLEAVQLPAETPFVRVADAAGVRVVRGPEIMMLQALEQFVRYTGARPTPAQVAAAEAYASA